LENVITEDRYSPENPKESQKAPAARYAYYRRCQVFRRNGQQCKAPAEKGAQICYAHAGQLAMAVRRERERRAVLAEAVAEMRRRGRPECEMADLFTDFKGIQVTLAVMARAVINGRIDCKTAGQMVVHLQTLSKLLWQVHRKRRKDLPLIHTDDTDLRKLPKIVQDEKPEPVSTGTRRSEEKPLQSINTDNTDRKKHSIGMSWAAAFSARRLSDCRAAIILQFEETAFGDRSRAHSPPILKAA
jgi:hypothetical protein